MRSPDLKRWREPSTWKEAAYDPNVRALVFQALLALAIALLAYEIVSNTIESLRKQALIEYR